MPSFYALFVFALCMRSFFMPSFYALFVCTLFLCPLFMRSLYVLFVCALCMRCLYALFVCALCMRCLYALFVCPLCSPDLIRAPRLLNFVKGKVPYFSLYLPYFCVFRSTISNSPVSIWPLPVYQNLKCFQFPRI